MSKSLKRILSSLLAVTMLVSCVIFVGTGSVAVGAAEIKAQSAGWHEVAYTEWTPVSGAAKYEAYVKTASASDWTKLDDMLIRQYNTYCRADALGLAAGTYNMKIVAKDSSDAEIASYVSGAITVDNYDRSGFAFSKNSPAKSASGGYNDDGTPKSGARILYITDENKDTVTLSIKQGKNDVECVGLGAIIKGLEKQDETRPLIVRFIGHITDPKSEQNLNQLDIKKSLAPITFEGVGPDTIIKFAFNVVDSTNIEFRNMGFKDMTTKDEDGVTIKGGQNIWVHHNDFFYGGHGSDKDQAKGDGSVDLKDASNFITVSDNHYWDSGKVNLCGLGEEPHDHYITYSRNWFDHSDSRHPRVRGYSVHVYNNFYDGVSKYGVGATRGSSVFVDSNYFRNTTYPVLISKQGTDAQGDSIFSEDGGIIKMYGNIMVGQEYKYIEGAKEDGTYSQNADGYSVKNRTDTLPSSLVTLVGGTPYNNFDTNSSVDLGLGISKLGILDAKDVPSKVVMEAGRIDMSNFRYDFKNDNATDKDYNNDPELEKKLAALSNTIINFGGEVKTQPNTSMAPESTLGVDGNTAYQEKAKVYEDRVKDLPKETDPTGNKATGGGTTGQDNIISTDMTYGKADFGNSKYFTESGGSTNVYAHDTRDAIRIKKAGSISFTVAEGATIKICAAGANDTDNTRTLTLSGPVSKTVTLPVASSEYPEVTYAEDAPAGTYTINVTKDADINKISITFKNKPADPTTTTEVTSQPTTDDVDNDSTTSTTQAPPVVGDVYGDADGSAQLGIVDAADLFNFVLNGVIAQDNGTITSGNIVESGWMHWLDVNADNAIDSADVAEVLQKVLDSNYKMPVER